MSIVQADSLPLALIVDDHDDTRHLYAEFLRTTGFNVVEAADGRLALATAVSVRPDVIVTETRLPGITGFDLCRLLRSDGATNKIPIVFVTADAYEVDVKRAHAAGAAAVLIKPCLPERLARELRHAIGRLQEPGDRANTDASLERLRATPRRPTLASAHQRHETTDPPKPPPTLLCPSCDQPLRYLKSHIGGVSQNYAEQWDYFECATCGTFQYRQRTRKLRAVV